MTQGRGLCFIDRIQESNMEPWLIWILVIIGILVLTVIDGYLE